MMRTQRNLYLAIAAFLTYAIAWSIFASPMDQAYWNARYFLSERPAPENIVVVKLDGAAAQAGDNGDGLAKVLQNIKAARPEHVFLDANLKTVGPALHDALEHWGDDISLVVRPNQLDFVRDDATRVTFDMPESRLTESTAIVVAANMTNAWKYAVVAPCDLWLDGRAYRSLAAAAAGVDCGRGSIRPNFAMDPAAVPIVSARKLVADASAGARLAGKTVLISAYWDKRQGVLGYYGHRQQPLAAFDVAGAAGAQGRPIVRWDVEILAVIFAALVIAAQNWTSRRVRYSLYLAGSLVGLIGPVAFESLGMLVPAGSTLVLMAVFAAWKLWSRWRRRVIETGNAGLPNFVALGNQKVPAGFNVVVAVIGRYDEFLATLPTDLHAECARQIARRFSVGCGTVEIHHGEGGHFAWIELDRDADNQIEHYEGMRALFSAPLLVGGHMFDTNVHFGIDRNSQFDTLTRLNTALASAADALANGRTIEQFEAHRLANAPWELSLLARIDEGMRNGDIWLAYQPQWDYAENRISGAEALIRWNDPVRGPIRPDEFILQAERAGRIDALTYWVLEQAITSAEIFNALGPRFQMSINLSAQLVDKASLVSATSEIVRRRGIDCSLLTIEVTETASVYNRPAAIRNLRELQAMGFRLSIDDFGTGEASLCYLADLPSDELKLDRRFVSRIVESERDRKIVQSTIRLAHALGQTVVGEGIEDITTFDMLRRMKCDVAQGYYVGKPETLEQLRTRYLSLGRQEGKAFTTC